MLYVHYDEENGKILGFYTLDRNSHIPKPNLQVTADIRTRVMRDPKRFKVDNGRVIEIEDFEPEFSEESLMLQRKHATVEALEAPVRVGDYHYIFDEFTQRNIILSYIAVAASKKHAKLWCRNNKKQWVFRTHTKREIERLAEAFTTLRENESEKLHAKLDSDSEST